MKKFEGLEVWFVTGSQHLYGPEALAIPPVRNMVNENVCSEIFSR
jgi:L-arabinose isomerase